MAALAQSNAQLGDLSRCHHRTSARPSSAGVGLQLGQLLCCIWVGWFFWGGGGSTMSQSSERSAWAPQKLCLTSQPDSVSLVRGDPASSCAGGAAQHLLGSHWAQREGNPQGTSAQCQRRGTLIQPHAGGSGWAAGTAEPCQAESPLMWLSVTPGEVPSPPPTPSHQQRQQPLENQRWCHCPHPSLRPQHCLHLSIPAREASLYGVFLKLI